MSGSQRFGTWSLGREHFLCIAGIAIAVGLGPTPEELSEGVRLLFVPPAHGSTIAYLFIVVARIAAYLPLAIGLFALATSVRFSNRVAAICAGLVFGIGALLSWVVAAFSGPGFGIAFVQGVTLTFAVSASVLFLGRSQWSSDARAFCIGSLALAIVMTLWSLSVVATVVYQADRIADGRPFCIAHHGEGKAIRSFYELRGVSFYTTRSGYKLTSRWYFHAVLISDGEGAFNWSHGRMRFDRVKTDGRLFGSVLGSCDPRKNFFATLDIF